jgi:glycosyltransferase involved in cell wall biosynthesis
MAQIHNASGIHAEVGTSLPLLKLARRLYQRADAIVAVSTPLGSSDSTRNVCSGCTIPCRSAPSGILPGERTPCRYRGPTCPFIVACGRLVRMKGFSDLLQAFAKARKDHVLQLVILGEGPERGNLRERARELGIEGDVLMPGFVANPWSYFGRARAFVLSSLFGESFSMVLVEAMACGVPVM